MTSGSSKVVKEMLEYLDRDSDGGNAEDSDDLDLCSEWSGTVFDQPEGTAIVESSGDSQSDSSLAYLDARQHAPQPVSSWREDLFGEQDGTGKEPENDPDYSMAQAKDKPTLASKSNATVCVGEKSVAYRVDPLGIPPEILLRSIPVADRITRKIAYKRRSRVARHAEEPTVLHSLERRMKLSREAMQLKWGWGVVHDMMLVDASKSLRWSQGLFENGVLRMEAQEIAGADSFQVEAELFHALSPSDVCERVFVSDENFLLLDLRSSHVGGFDVSSIVQVLQLNGRQIQGVLKRSRMETNMNSSSCKDLMRLGHCSSLGPSLGCQFISKINLQNNKISDREVAILVMGLREAPAVKELNLSENHDITWKGAALIAELLDTRSIVHHYKNKKRTSQETGISPGTNLTHLNLSDTSIGDRGLEILCNKLVFNSSVTDLIVNYCKISQTSAGIIGWLINENSVLKILDIGWNGIGARGAALLSSGLQPNASLHTLNLSHNGLGDIGGSHIGYALTENQGLKILDLSNNSIGSNACTVIAEAMSSNTTLEVLLLSNNPLGEDGGRCLLQGLADNATLKRIGLQGSTFLESNMLSATNIFNRRNPNGDYKLDLHDPSQRHIAVELARIRRAQGESTWQNIRLNGEPFELVSAFEWTKRMPEDGILELTFKAAESPPIGVKTISTGDLSSIMHELSDSIAEDKWRITFLHIVADTFFFSSAQVAELLQTFEWRKDKIQAVTILFARIVDPQNINVVTQNFSESEYRMLISNLGILAFFSPDNPTGCYELDMSRQLHRVVMARLVETSVKEGFWRSNEAFRNFRSVCFNKDKIDLGSPATYELPFSGFMKFDFVSLKEVFKQRHPLHPWTKQQSAVSSFTFFQLTEIILLLIALNRQPSEEENTEAPQPTIMKTHSKKSKEAKNTKPISDVDEQDMEAEADGPPVQIPSNFDRRRRSPILPTYKAPDAFNTIKLHIQELEELKTAGFSRSEAWKIIMNKMEAAGTMTHDFVSNWDDNMPSLKPRDLIRFFLTKDYVTCQQVCSLMDAVIELQKVHNGGDSSSTFGTEKLEILQTLFNKTIDLSHFTSVLKKLTPKEQAGVYDRLGILNVIDFDRMGFAEIDGLHFSLLQSRPDDTIALRKLCDLAVRTKEGICIHDLVINEEPAKIPEDKNLLSMISTVARERAALTGLEARIRFKMKFPQKCIREEAAFKIQAAFRTFAVGHTRARRLQSMRLPSRSIPLDH